MSQGDLTAIYAAIGAYYIFFIALMVFIIVCNWRIFQKAGHAGWKSIIPVYGSYIDYDISWSGAVFIFTIILGVLSAFIRNIYVVGVISIIQIILLIVKQVKLGKRFGKGGAFGFFLLFLLPFIGYPILAFSSADYDYSRSA